MDPKLARFADYLKIDVSPVVSVNFHDMSQHTTPFGLCHHLTLSGTAKAIRTQHATHRNTTRPKCFACRENPTWTYLKCGACHEK